MQISSVQPGSVRSGEVAAPSQQPVTSGETKQTGRKAEGPLRGGLSSWKPELNQEISTAQKVLGFLNEAENQLHALKAELSLRLGNRQGSDAKLETQIQKFDSLWKKRHQATGGSLNGQLAYQGSGKARQSFRISGFDAPLLQAGAKERLEFSLGADAARTVAITLDEGMPLSDVVRRLDKGLYPLGLRAHGDKEGGIAFSAPESLWNEVRNSLAVKGSGVRVADGRFHRVNVEPDAEVVRPQEWRTDETVMMRKTLQEVVQALDWIGRARLTVNQVLAEIRRDSADFAAQVDGGWAHSFAEKFETLTSQAQYQLFYSIAPALQSVSRSRVQALLALR